MTVTVAAEEKNKKQAHKTDNNNQTNTIRDFHCSPSEMSQPIIVNATQRMFAECKDMCACCPGSHKAKQLEEDIFFK